MGQQQRQLVTCQWTATYVHTHTSSKAVVWWRPGLSRCCTVPLSLSDACQYVLLYNGAGGFNCKPYISTFVSPIRWSAWQAAIHSTVYHNRMFINTVCRPMLRCSIVADLIPFRFYLRNSANQWQNHGTQQRDSHRSSKSMEALHKLPALPLSWLPELFFYLLFWHICTVHVYKLHTADEWFPCAAN